MFKKAITLIFISLGTYQQVVGQDQVTEDAVAADSISKISLGFRGGANYSRLSFSGESKTVDLLETDTRNHIRPQAGLVVNYGLGDMTSLQGELLFSQKGIKNKGVTSEAKELVEYKNQVILNYVEVPVLFKVSRPFPGDSLRLFLNAGPSVAFLINGKEKYKSTFSETESDIRFSADGDNAVYKRLEASVHAGIGFEVLKSYGTFALEARYVYGLTNVYKLPVPAAEDEVTSRNQSIGVYFTYLMPRFVK